MGINLGASFSHNFLKYLGLDTGNSLEDFKSLGLSWIRLGCYWSEIEQERGEFDFSELDKIILFCERENINIVLCVGMKASRYPEFYLPEWTGRFFKSSENYQINPSDSDLLQSTLLFIEKCINHYKGYSSIKVWQIENEPLDPSGEKYMSISPDFLAQEVSLARSLDSSRKIALTLWGNELSKRNLYPIAVDLADIVGVDIYPRQSYDKEYVGPLDTLDEFQQIAENIKNKDKEFWVSEVQMEPWEPGEVITSLVNPPSCLPEHLATNLQLAKEVNPSAIFLWGFEWWCFKKENGDSRYWNEAKCLIENS